MTTTEIADTGTTSEYARELGKALRRHRKALGWTRLELQEHLPAEDSVSRQTLATYELGTRQIPVHRLAALCQAMGTCASALLAEVEDRVTSGNVFAVDLARLAATDRPHLAPIAKWAAITLAAIGQTWAELTPAALANLAELCDLEFSDLASTLYEFRRAA